MKVEDITDKNLLEFLNWYRNFHGCRPVGTSVMTTCMCGYFGTYSKAADKLLARCKRLKLVAVAGGIVTITSSSDDP